MSTAVVLLNFGEPEDATMESVVPFLERIFDLNRNLETHATAVASRERTRALAAARAPGLIEEYNAIGGSPLHRQAQAQAELLETELRARGIDAFAVLGMQFTAPFIDSAVHGAMSRGATRFVGLPVYPLCGPTTTVAALESLRDAVTRLAPGMDLWEISGWHRHPAYSAMRGSAVRAVADAAGVSLRDRHSRLVFSAHGTPIKYLDEGSRYVDYVKDSCARVAEAAGATAYSIGYQNHSNRPLEWTQPDIDSVIDQLADDGIRDVVVDAISFMHEQSETLAELDLELREHAEGRGLRFHRVPVPFDDPAFIRVLADLVEPFASDGNAVGRDAASGGSVSGGSVSGASVRGGAAGSLRPCVCRATRCTFCLNGAT
ncbi:MAG TPA: ferrochelatase [Longimicrobiales bacterium]